MTGWVRNALDGRVVFHIQGKPEAVDQMLAWARVGPAGARVDRMVYREGEISAALDNFEVR